MKKISVTFLTLLTCVLLYSFSSIKENVVENNLNLDEEVVGTFSQESIEYNSQFLEEFEVVETMEIVQVGESAKIKVTGVNNDSVGITVYFRYNGCGSCYTRFGETGMQVRGNCWWCPDHAPYLL